jgi:hypothetical protein
VSDEAEGHPVFFLSYAHEHLGTQRNQVLEFFDELCALVADMAGLRAGEVPGFIDTSIGAGREWNTELLTAVGTCKVFVALLSPKYFTSEWCGREWFAFAQREVTGESLAERAMVPVRWLNWRDHPIPPAINRIQWFSLSRYPAIDDTYQEEGLRGMIYMNDDNAQTVLWRLASRIVDISESHHVKRLTLRPEDLRNAFEEGG